MTSEQNLVVSLRYILGDPKDSGEYSVFRLYEFNELDKPQKKKTFVGNYDSKAILDYLSWIKSEVRSHKPRMRKEEQEIKVYIPGRPWHLVFVPRYLTNE